MAKHLQSLDVAVAEILWTLRTHPRSCHWAWWKWDKRAQPMSDREMGSCYASTNILSRWTDQMKIALHETAKWFTVDSHQFEVVCWRYIFAGHPILLQILYVITLISLEAVRSFLKIRWIHNWLRDWLSRYSYAWSQDY